MIKTGDRVQYKTEWLRSIGMFTIPVEIGIKGTVKSVTRLSNHTILIVEFEPENGEKYESLCNIENVEKVKGD